MRVTGQIRLLEQAGYQGECLDRAVALAGARRRIYQALLAAVERGETPERALAAAEQSWREDR